MKKYALLIALAIAPSLAHDNLEIEGISNTQTKAKFIAHNEPHHTHEPATINQDPFVEHKNADDKVVDTQNLETLIAEAEKTIAKLDGSKTDHIVGELNDTPKSSEHQKIAFNKWAGINPTPSSNYISGGGSASGSGGGGSGGGSSGGGKGTSTADNATNDDTTVATAVPEPEIYLMFLTGLGLIGYNIKKRTIKG